MEAHGADRSGLGPLWRQSRQYAWNGAPRVWLTVLDLARRTYLIKPPTKR
ncbi:hypothetical protein ACFY12_34650 [Streptomyces sp. NPDC001339]